MTAADHASQDTIVAISSPRGQAARGIVRLSGPKSIAIVEAFFEPLPGEQTMESLNYGAVSGHLLIGRSGVTAPVIVYVMRAPRSFTREDQVEVHTIGSPVLLGILSEIFGRRGARGAFPGEFTQRAFMNGRLDLAQAEAVAAVINANDEAERRAALRILDGAVSREIGALTADITALLTPLELAIDFSEQDIEIIDALDFVGSLGAIASRLDELGERKRRKSRFAGRVRVVLHGPANAGKSSLFNALVGEDRALVSGDPGTTRDFLEGELEVDGFAITLVDTAGDDFSASAEDEAAQILRREAVDSADLVIRVADGRLPVESVDEGGLSVLTRSDLVPTTARVSAADTVWLSPVSREGLADLRLELARRLRGADVAGSNALLHLDQRHRDCVGRAREAIDRAGSAVTEGQGHELVAADLREALAAVGEITGIDYDEEVLNGIFRDFCIGK